MRYLKLVFALTALLASAGCSSLNCNLLEGKALPGTETVVVGVYIDKKGYPQVSVDPITVHPGQKIIFAGPERFDIFFKDNKSPTDKIDNASMNGVVSIEIPKDIFEQEQRKQRTAAGPAKQLLYKYGIRANGKITDPVIIIEPRLE